MARVTKDIARRIEAVAREINETLDGYHAYIGVNTRYACPETGNRRTGTSISVYRTSPPERVYIYHTEYRHQSITDVELWLQQFREELHRKANMSAADKEAKWQQQHDARKALVARRIEETKRSLARAQRNLQDLQNELEELEAQTYREQDKAE